MCAATVSLRGGHIAAEVVTFRVRCIFVRLCVAWVCVLFFKANPCYNCHEMHVLKDRGSSGCIRLVLELCEGGELYDRIQQKQYR